MSVHNVVGTGRYTTSTTNMYKKYLPLVALTCAICAITQRTNTRAANRPPSVASSNTTTSLAMDNTSFNPFIVAIPALLVLVVLVLLLLLVLVLLVANNVPSST